jgi:CheY-like chemotaxis protein
MQPTRLAAQSPLPIRSILIVDTDADTRRLYKTVLGEIGETIAEAEDGAEALSQALRGRPDVVITGAHLPRVNGFALCSLLRTEPATRSAAIIVMTTGAVAAVATRAATAGADEVLAEPCAPETLLDAVVRVRERQSGSGAAPTPRGAVTKVRARQRCVTRQPPRQPPALHCPQCDRLLQYDRSHIGGVSDAQPEQWDYFVCGDCGTFQYRVRTRKLRRIAAAGAG